MTGVNCGVLDLATVGRSSIRKLNFFSRANLTAVRIYRIWLLVLLAVLIPVRGAVASAMLCPPAGTGASTEAQAHHHPAHGADHDHAAGADAGAADSGSGHHDHGTADKCNLCASYCSLTGLVSHSPSVPAQHLAAATFPGVNAPVPSFFSGGQERPPRTT